MSKGDDKKKKVSDYLQKLSKKIEDLAIEEKARREKTKLDSEEPLIDDNSKTSDFDPAKILEKYTQQEALNTRMLEFANGTFFWRCLIHAGLGYQPTFNKRLFDNPEIAGEPRHDPKKDDIS